ncbi:glycosyltransferase family 4 protein [Candidatus Shapirobacteria bacterium]|nr:glycosyltransferase family 4 protein [Candidatus Shapirobacteria bacterium]
MKIGILFDGPEIPPKGGVGYRFYYLSHFLAKKGIEIVGFMSDRNTCTVNQLKKEPFKTHLFSPRTFYKDTDFVLDVIRKENVDLIQVNNSQTALLLGAKYSQALGIPLVTEMHDVDSTLKMTLNAKKEKTDELEFVQYCAGKLSQEVVCMTELDKEELINLGINKTKINLIPNGIDIEYFHYTTPNLTSGQAVFLGNMFYRPNRNAAKVLITKVIPKTKLKLVCIGMVEEKFKEKYACERVMFTGPVDDIRPILKKSSIAIAPIFQGSGMKVKILNFAAAGLPTITTSLGISGYPSEVAIVENDVNKYPKIIEEVMSSVDATINRTKNSREIIEKYFSWEPISDKVIEMYKKILKNNLCFTGQGFDHSDTMGWKHYSLAYQRKTPLPIWLEESRTKYGKERFKYIDIIK